MSGTDPSERVQAAMASYQRAQLSRRELLKRLGIGVVTIGAAPSLLAACGGGEETATTQAPATTETPATAAAETAATEAAEEAVVPEASGSVDFLSWEGYDLPDVMKAWKNEHSVQLNPTYIGSHNDIEAKLKASENAEGFDLITYYQGFKPLYQELGILSPLDPAKLPNLANLYPFFASDERNFWVNPDGTRTGVPWTFGAQGIQYDSAVVKEPPASNDELFDPKYTGKVVVVDDAAGNFAQTAHLLGHDVGALTQDQFAECQDYLRRLVAQTNGVAPSFGDYTSRLVAGDAVIGFLGWAAVNQFAKDAGKETIEMSLPEEGGISFCDSYAIPPGSDNVDTALAWINQVLDPEVNAAAADYLIGGVTVEGAVDFLSPEIAAFYPYDQLDDLLSRFPFYNNAPVTSDEYVTFEQVLNAWQEIKAGA